MLLNYVLGYKDHQRMLRLFLRPFGRFYLEATEDQLKKNEDNYSCAIKTKNHANVEMLSFRMMSAQYSLFKFYYIFFNYKNEGKRHI